MKGWYGDRQRHAIASKGIRSNGKLKQYKPRTGHEFADEFPFWTLAQIKEFEDEFGKIEEITSWGTVKTEYGEYMVFESYDDAYAWAKEDLINMWEMDEGTFPVDWVVEENIYISPTDRRIIAGEEADSRTEDLDDEEVLRMYDEYKGEDAYEENEELEEKIFELEERFEELEDEEEHTESIIKELNEIEEKIRELNKERDKLLQNCLDALHYEIYEEVYDGLEDPIEYFVREQGISSKEDLMKANFIMINYEGMAESVLDTDGVAHIVARYDGNENELNGAYIYRVD